MIHAGLIGVSKEPIPGVDIHRLEKRAQSLAAKGPKRIVIVDDDAAVLGIISKMISCLGYEVVAGRNGSEGMALCEEKSCVLVLTDLEMPAMDGLTLAREIKRKYPSVPVVLMTGNQAIGEKIETEMQKGFIDDFLLKPLGLANLRGMLQRLSPA